MNAPYCEEGAGRRRCYRFAYVQGRHDREWLPHQTRDAEAALLLLPVLLRLGFRYAGPILNYPPKHQAAGTRMPMAPSFLQPGDLVWTVTRPPWHDRLDGVRDRVDRSYTELEDELIAVIGRHFSHCSRSRVSVADVHARAFPEVARMSNVQFRQKGGAAVDAFLMYDGSRWQRAGADCRTSLAYLIFEERAWENGPGFLASFGMCATDTLVWNYLLATKYPELVATVPFVMAQITAPKRPARPHTMEFAGDWKVRFLTPNVRAAI
jgi:hypothetical protein